MGPTTAESPTCARSDKCGTVTGGCDATVVLSHPSAAAHAAPSARGRRLKRRTHAAPHESGHVRPPPAEDPRARLATLRRFKPRRNIPSGVPLPSKESHSEALLIRGSKPGPSGGSTGASDRQSQELQGRAVQATLKREVRDILRSVQGRSRVPRRGIPSRESIEPSNPTEWVRAPPSEPSQALYETCLWTTSQPLSNGARTSA